MGCATLILIPTFVVINVASDYAATQTCANAEEACQLADDTKKRYEHHMSTRPRDPGDIIDDFFAAKDYNGLFNNTLQIAKEKCWQMGSKTCKLVLCIPRGAKDVIGCEIHGSTSTPYLLKTDPKYDTHIPIWPQDESPHPPAGYSLQDCFRGPLLSWGISKDRDEVCPEGERRYQGNDAIDRAQTYCLKTGGCKGVTCNQHGPRECCAHGENESSLMQNYYAMTYVPEFWCVDRETQLSDLEQLLNGYKMLRSASYDEDSVRLLQKLWDRLDPEFALLPNVSHAVNEDLKRTVRLFEKSVCCIPHRFSSLSETCKWIVLFFVSWFAPLLWQFLSSKEETVHSAKEGKSAKRKSAEEQPKSSPDTVHSDKEVRSAKSAEEQQKSSVDTTKRTTKGTPWWSRVREHVQANYQFYLSVGLFVLLGIMRLLGENVTCECIPRTFVWNFTVDEMMSKHVVNRLSVPHLKVAPWNLVSMSNVSLMRPQTWSDFSLDPLWGRNLTVYIGESVAPVFEMSAGYRYRASFISLGLWNKGLYAILSDIVDKRTVALVSVSIYLCTLYPLCTLVLCTLASHKFTVTSVLVSLYFWPLYTLVLCTFVSLCILVITFCSWAISCCRSKDVKGEGKAVEGEDKARTVKVKINSMKVIVCQLVIGLLALSCFSESQIFTTYASGFGAFYLSVISKAWAIHKVSKGLLRAKTWRSVAQSIVWAGIGILICSIVDPLASVFKKRMPFLTAHLHIAFLNNGYLKLGDDTNLTYAFLNRTQQYQAQSFCECSSTFAFCNL